MDKDADKPLSNAATLLEEELVRFEELAVELGRPVNSEKSLLRARQKLGECSAFEERLANGLTAFVAAMHGMQARQQRCIQLIAEAAQQIQERSNARNSLLERVAALGIGARSVAEPMAAMQQEQPGADETTALLGSIQEVSTRLVALVSEAEAVALSAKESDWVDIARDADALKQQLQAVRNRLLLGQRKLASRAPS